MSVSNAQQRSALIEKLSAEVAVVPWSALESHAKRGSLFMIDQGLDLVEVGVSIAMDEHDTVATWIEHGLLNRAQTQPDVDCAGYRFLIIQPFLIAAPLLLPNH